jgi:hypothetical protein
MRKTKEIYEDIMQSYDNLENHFKFLEQEYYGRNIIEDNKHNRNI